MKFPVYSIRDTKGNQFNQLTVANNDYVIARSFAESLYNKRDMIMAFSPKDFDLYKVGEFDTEKGMMIPIVPIVLIGNAVEIMEQFKVERYENI